MITFTAQVDHIIFSKPETGWSVVVVHDDDQHVNRTVIGVLPDFQRGRKFKITGEEVESQYGKQIKVSSFEELKPVTSEEILRALTNGLVKGIGPSIAWKIVKRFGDKTMDILDNEPKRLLEVSGIGDKSIKKIIADLESQKNLRHIRVFLTSHDITIGLSKKIMDTYGDKAIEVLTENPYKLAEDIDGVAFLKADAVANSFGISETDPFRVNAGIVYAMKKLIEDGHTCSTPEVLAKRAAQDDILGIDESVVSKAIPGLIENGVLVNEYDVLYLPLQRNCEASVAKNLARLLSAPKRTLHADIRDIEKETGKEYNEDQANAITTALSSMVSIITGGPGTGKTVTTSAIIKAEMMAGKNVVLAAPTGRAAQRLSEVSGVPAKTLHRLLEWAPQKGFQKNESNPLFGDTLLVDEASMIDLSLMSSLLKAVPNKMRVVFIGDIDQLPSVGCGRILADIINSQEIPCVTLKKIYRQAMGSKIIRNAHAINSGYMPDLIDNINDDFRFFEEKDRERISKMIVRLVSKTLPEKKGLSPDDIQVICPMRKAGDPIGATEMNIVLQETLNPHREGFAIRYGNTEFRTGDRVMQMKNDYSKNVFNGDVGKIVSVDASNKSAMIFFNGVEVEYTDEDFEDLGLAYATTVHKSQGSEYKAVITPIHDSQYVMLQRNLLYTAITRSKTLCVMLGTKSAIHTAVGRTPMLTRQSKLIERITEARKKTNQQSQFQAEKLKGGGFKK